MENKKIICFFGPQGSGKGTQAKILAAKLNIPHISTGDLFRLAMKNETELGKQVKKKVNSGQYIEDEITFKLVQERITEDDCANGFILDGYPRTARQAELLDVFAEITKFVEVRISDEEALKRLTNRRQDPETGKIYNLYTAPKPTPEIEPRLIQRDDDREEAIKKRLAQYHNEADKILEHYKDKLVRVDGEQSIEKVAGDIESVLSLKS